MKYEQLPDGRIKFIDTTGISKATWNKLLARINYLNYDIPSVEFLKSYFDRGYPLNEDQSIEVLAVFGKKTDTTALPPVDIYNQKAKDTFGTTKDLSLCGYILTDGSLLKMSYMGLQRDMDHREIRDIMDTDDGSDAMITFINMGNIRLHQRSFEISKPLTDKQKPVIACVIAYAQKSDYPYMSVDIANPKGQVIKTFEYEYPTVSAVFNDINNYFDEISL